jgi:splicing factor 3B subunit 3
LFSHLYQIAHLGDNDDEPEFSSRIPLDEGETFFYDTRDLQNLILVDQIDSLNPMITSHVSWNSFSSYFSLIPIPHL